MAQSAQCAAIHVVVLVQRDIAAAPHMTRQPAQQQPSPSQIYITHRISVAHLDP